VSDVLPEEETLLGEALEVSGAAIEAGLSELGPRQGLGGVADGVEEADGALGFGGEVSLDNGDVRQGHVCGGEVCL